MKEKIVVLGGGPGGYTSAIRAAQLGGDVTLIEQHHLGGTCLNYGCIPSKLLKKGSDIIDSFKKASTFGISFEGSPSFNMASHVAHQQQTLQAQRKGVAALLQKNGIALVNGHGRIEGPGKIIVTDIDDKETASSWDKLIIATGSSPFSIPAFPFDHKHILSSSDILGLQEVPSSLLIVGGGVIGCEFGSIFASLGTRVTIVEALDRLLPIPSMDKEISKSLLREMKKKKITVLTKKTVSSASQSDNMLSIAVLDAGNNDSTKVKIIEAEKMLVSVGRTPNSSSIGLDAIGVECDARGWVKANKCMETNVEGVYAIGDIIGPDKAMLAHVAATEGEIAAENCLGHGKTMAYNTIPNAVFTSPEIGSVGLSEEQAIAKYGDKVDSTSVLYRSLGKAHATGEIAGSAKLIYHKQGGMIVGAHIIGARATDIISEATLAIQQQLTLNDIANTIHAHPTFSEILLEIAQKATGHPIHG